MGRANAGKTTILEKVCCVDPGTDTIIYNEHGVLIKGPKPWSKVVKSMKRLLKIKLVPSITPHLKPSQDVSCVVKLMYGSPPVDMQPILERHT